MSASTTKFADFLTSKKLDARRLIAASHQLETLQPEDRAIRLARRQAKKGDAPPPAAEGAAKVVPVKPRSGRPVTQRAMEAAMTGGTVSGPTKTRILKAINHLLVQKKQEKVELKALF